MILKNIMSILALGKKKGAKSSYRFSCALKIAALITLSVFITLPAHAQIADSPCDVDGYFESLKARAWMEAQREISQNQTLIQKADSVLQYSCFDKFAKELAKDASKLFSESERFGDVDLGGVALERHMDEALNESVGRSLISYTRSNFGHKLLGDRYEGANPAGTRSVQGGSYQPQAVSPAGAGYDHCDVMAAVWNKVLCADFTQNPQHDGFFTFEDFSASDKRFPAGSCGSGNPMGAEWSQNIQKANPDPLDPMKTYLSLINAQNCTQSIAISTGITVKRPQDNPKNFEEKICVKPGCNYSPGGSGSGGGGCKPN